MPFCVNLPHFTHIGSLVLLTIKMAAVAAQYYVWFRIWSHYSHQKAKISYTQTKYCRQMNIRLRYKYFRFRRTNFGHIGNPYLISTLSTLSAIHGALVCQILWKKNQTIVGGVIMSYRFSRWRPLWRNFTVGFGFGTVSLFTKVKVNRQMVVMRQSMADI